MTKDNYTENDYDRILLMLQNKIILDRCVLGFKDDLSKEYSSSEMMEKAIELEVYKSIKRHVQNKRREKAWIDFYNENKEDLKLVNNKNEYKDIFFNVYEKINIMHLCPNKVIDYIKKEEFKLRNGELVLG